MSDQLNIINILKSSKRVAILSHIYPDGDAVGSSLALFHALKGQGKEVDIFLRDGVPVIYSFLEGTENVRKQCEAIEYDTAVALDAGDIERLGECSVVFNSAKTKINIDHHVTNSHFADINFIESSASSTGEIIYRLIKMYGLDIDKKTAECLFTAISTDTGGFRYSNTTSISMQVSADLINCGIDVSEISRKVFDVTSLTKVKVTGEAISTLEIFSDKISVMHLTKEKIAELGAAIEDLDGVINIARNISGIEAAAFLVEKAEGEIKINLRSNSYIDVADIAQKFSGGGHKRAAGCRINNLSINEAKILIVEELKKALQP